VAGPTSAERQPYARPALRTLPTYQIAAGLEGEVYPAFANYASLQRPDERRWGTIAITITNSTDAPLRNRLTVKVPGWSDEEIQLAEMPAGDRRTYLFAPTFLPRFFQNHEIAAATALVTVTDMAGRQLFTGTAPVRLRAVGDMFWGADFKYAPFIASWVTPHDPEVEQILAVAKQYMPGQRLPGYEPRKSAAAQERSTRLQARAIYRALQRTGVSYVKSSMTFGGNQGWSERVRTPRQSLAQRSANCIDAAVMYASLFENLGLEPVVVVVPGHAYVGVRTARGSSRYLYIETAQTARIGFEAAVAAAERSIARYPLSQIRLIKIHDAREAGIFPLPLP
jgi:transglutaminase-like putative cysteine protease